MVSDITLSESTAADHHFEDPEPSSEIAAPRSKMPCSRLCLGRGRRGPGSSIRIAVIASLTVAFLILIRQAAHNKELRDILLLRKSQFQENGYWDRLTSDQIHHLEKVDWHDREQIKRDAERKGPAERGQSFQLPPDLEAQKDKLYKVNGFNALASDQISLNRSLTDIRHPKCDSRHYISQLPTASVIVPFHNEHLSTLLRTAASLINRAPRHLLREVLLVDDASTKDHAKAPYLDDLVQRMFHGVVRVVHLARRSGLITARLEGARLATSDVLIFIDSHCEAGVNYLPPLLEPIALDKRTCVCPFIDVIDFEDFQYRAQDEGARGAFDWEFFYKRLDLLPQDKANMPEPFPSPVMAGGLFAISRDFFWELGGYDPELDIWGGEQYELSFKIWMCGGQMLDAPCSRIGHVYRKFAPFPNPRKDDFVAKNYRRVADVWMDDYAKYLYKRRPHYQRVDPGDLAPQRAIRERLKCRSFQWFMDTVAFDLVKKYPPIEPGDIAHGEIRSVADPSLCVDTRFKPHSQRFGMEKCMKDEPGLGGEQTFHLTWRKDLRAGQRPLCWDVPGGDQQAPVFVWDCHGQQGNQFWTYDTKHQWLVHAGSRRCLDGSPERREIYVSRCDPKARTQRWTFEHFNATELAKISY
ncbi:N-acetylgalactosaminyltransferase 6-like isoform X2 [Pollicipes pollicipes]|uniref:N-acetylgalactosaminyltransferase 6-like isoform X2 n=1 Tax=Pollicipes pollicipes TaxID=41117 RepID=UPI0018858FA9|nr:N-acetylgalactosaminyltransferase 6-like isoform X2 [Pollicipes pollicipes]